MSGRMAVRLAVRASASCGRTVPYRHNGLSVPRQFLPCPPERDSPPSRALPIVQISREPGFSF